MPETTLALLAGLPPRTSRTTLFSFIDKPSDSQYVVYL
jgi:hypothetical protein